MTPLQERLKLDKPNRAHTMAFIALFVGFGCIALTIGLYYQGKSADSSKELHRLQTAFCGTPGDPGLLPLVASEPVTPQTTALGRGLVSGSQRAQIVIQCGKGRG